MKQPKSKHGGWTGTIASLQPKRMRAWWGPDEPIHYPTDRRGNPTWKYTIAPPLPEPRFTNTHSR